MGRVVPTSRATCPTFEQADIVVPCAARFHMATVRTGATRRLVSGSGAECDEVLAAAFVDVGADLEAGFES